MEQADFALGDQPQEHDLLGYQPYARTLAQMIASDQLQTPFTLGIYGPWGTGKSTFMHLLRKELRADGLYTMAFQPWQFDEKEEVWKALIYTVLEYLQRLDEKRSAAERQNAKLQNLIKGLGKLALNEVVMRLTDERVSLDQVAHLYSQHQRDNAQFINTFRAEFRDAKREILGGDDDSRAKIYVFVDDLDRCTPESCIMVLEAIKLFFDMEGCVFVMGIDREVVQRGIEVKYRRTRQVSGQDYLEKIIQLPFVLPPVERDTFQRFVEIIARPFDFDETTLALMVEAAAGNPRRIKRLSNSLNLVRRVALETAGTSAEREAIDEKKLALLLMLQVRYPLAYNWLTSYPQPLRKVLSEWEDRHRDPLLTAYTRRDGRERGRESVDGFQRFLVFALDTLGLKDFEGPEELGRYLRATGVVEEPKELQRVSTPDVYDIPLRREGEAEGPPDEVQTPPVKDDAEKPEAVDVEFSETNELVERWHAIRERGAFELATSSLTRFCDDVVDCARRAAVIADTLERRDDRESLEVRTAAVQLAEITPGRARDQLAATSQLLETLMLLVPMGLYVGLGALIFYLAPRATSKADSFVELLLYPTASDPMLGVGLVALAVVVLLLFRTLAVRNAMRVLHREQRERLERIETA